MPALARSQAADSRCPLFTAKHAEISSKSAASAKLEHCGFGHRRRRVVARSIGSAVNGAR
eukprot:5548160-Pleurochrysis_carterae.AAC.1